MSVWSGQWPVSYCRIPWVWTIPRHSTEPTEAYSRSPNRGTPRDRLLSSVTILKKRWISWGKHQASAPFNITTKGSSFIWTTLLLWGSVGLLSKKQESCWATVLTPGLASCSPRHWKSPSQMVNRDHSTTWLKQRSTLLDTYRLGLR